MTSMVKIISGMVAVLLCSQNGAQADGEFFQFDYSPGASSVVGSMTRDRISFSSGWSEYSTGSAASANLTYSFPIDSIINGAIFKIGPSIRLDDADRFSVGGKASVESWRATSWGGIFMLGDYNTIQQEYLILAEALHDESGFGISVATQGGIDGFKEDTIALSYKIPGSSLKIRLGRRYRDDTTFIGFSINTF